MNRLLGASDFLWEDFLRRQHSNLLPLLDTDDQPVRREAFVGLLRHGGIEGILRAGEPLLAALRSGVKTVLIPDLRAGCSLADSISPESLEEWKERYPGHTVVTYINSSAEVKALSDICCTSANAVEVVESLGADRVIFIPDGYLGRYVASKTEVEIILWQGACEVHERFTAAASAVAANAVNVAATGVAGAATGATSRPCGRSSWRRPA